jgi:hypothetical protein
MKSRECATRFGEMWRRRVERDVSALEGGENGFVGEAEKLGSFLRRELT